MTQQRLGNLGQFSSISSLTVEFFLVKHPYTNGFVERFHRTALDAFFRVAFPTKYSDTVDALQDDFDQRLGHNNTERPYLGYRNLGKRPIDIVETYVQTREPGTLEA